MTTQNEVDASRQTDQTEAETESDTLPEAAVGVEPSQVETGEILPAELHREETEVQTTTPEVSLTPLYAESSELQLSEPAENDDVTDTESSPTELMMDNERAPEVTSLTPADTIELP